MQETVGEGVNPNRSRAEKLTRGTGGGRWVQGRGVQEDKEKYSRKAGLPTPLTPPPPDNNAIAEAFGSFGSSWGVLAVFIQQ